MQRTRDIMRAQCKQAQESSQHCFLREQTGKHLLRTQIVSQKHFLRLERLHARENRETFVFAAMFPRLRWPRNYT